MEDMKCSVCKKDLPTIHWKLLLSEPATTPVHRYCGICYQGPRGVDWMNAWADITQGTVQWFRVHASA